MRNLLVAYICLFSCVELIRAQSALYVNGLELYTDDNALLHVEGDILFESGASLTNRGDLEVTGDWQNDVGAALTTEDSGSIILNGSSLQTISGTTELYRLEIDNANGVTISSGQNVITHTLTLTNGTLTTNDSLYLRSDANRTARVAEVTGGSASGDFIIERYIETAQNNWRMLSIPIQNATINEWYGDFATSGFTGSQFPSFPFISVYFYDETITGTAEDGYVPATNITNSLADGEGGWAYIGPLPVTVDVVGEINIGTINYPVSYTPDLGASSDGWCQLGNPYPSAIDWDASSGWTKTNMNNAIYVWDGELDQYRSYVGGVGTLGGTSEIASMQSFFVQSNAASPALSSTEEVKINDDAEFVNSPNLPINLLRIQVTGWGFLDETVMRFLHESTQGFDPLWDAYKPLTRNQYAPTIGTYFDSVLYSINSIDPDSLNRGVDLMVQSGWPGDYTIEITEVPTLPSNFCYYLEDLVSGEKHPLDSGYSFTVFLDTGITDARFRIHAYQPAQIESSMADCYGDYGAELLFTPNGTGPWYVTLFDSIGTMLYNDSLYETYMKDSLRGGFYSYWIDDPSGCGFAMDSIIIDEKDQIEAQTSVVPQSGYPIEYTVTVEPQGGTPPYLVFWDWPIGLYGPVLFNADSGLYHFKVTDDLGCELDDSVAVIPERKPDPIDTNEITGWQNGGKGLIKVYPNPSSGLIQIDGLMGKDLNITVFDAKGQLVHRTKELKSTSTLDLTQLQSGVYQLNIETNSQIISLSIIIE